MQSREQLIFLARLNLELQRSADAVRYVSELAVNFPVFSDEDRGLFDAVYKGAINPIRQTLKTIKTFYEEQQMEKNGTKAEALKEHGVRAYGELAELVQGGIALINQSLAPEAESPRAQVFYLRMTGNLVRYLAECGPKGQQAAIIEKAKRSYDKALCICNEALELHDHVRLDVILAMAVFHYEHLKDRAYAVELLEETIRELENVNIGSDATAMIETMKTNLGVWSAQN